MTSTKEHVTQHAVDELRLRPVSPGTVLMSFKLSMGKVVVASVPMYTNEAIAHLPIRDPSLLDPAYLCRALEQLDLSTKGDRAAMGATLNKAKLRALMIPLPPIEEQRRIAAILDQADELRAKRRASIELADSLAESIFLDMFGDPVVNPFGWRRFRLGDVLDGIDSGKSPVCLDRPAGQGEWGVLKLGAITSGNFREDEQKALPPGTAFDPRLEVRQGDLLFSRKNTRSHVAATVLVGHTRRQLLLSDLVFRLRLRPEASVLPAFLQRQMAMPSRRREIQRLAGGSAGSMPNISKARLSDVLTEVPPMDLQRNFVERLESVSAGLRRRAGALDMVHDLFAGLQHSAFRGEL